VQVDLQIGFVGKFFKSFQFDDQVALLVTLSCDYRGEGSHHEGIESNSQKHPHTGHRNLSCIVSSKVSITHGCESLESPVQGLNETIKLIGILETLLNDPSVVCEVIHLGRQVEDASKDMDHECRCYQDEADPGDRGIDIELLDLLIQTWQILLNLDELQQSKHPHEIVPFDQSHSLSIAQCRWDPCLEELSWSTSQNINPEGAKDIVTRNLLQTGLITGVISLIWKQEGDEDIHQEDEISESLESKQQR
jgi:hypothetical protein